MTHLTDAEIAEALRGLPGWSRQAGAITKQYTFPSFPDAVAGLVRLAFDAEAADHHPDVTISYRRVTLAYSTHSEGALTHEDIEGARAAERVFGGLAG
jgi:4a-hydroxytetrahydrobiopterin dehydratase